jgi:hypothetical protein
MVKRISNGLSGFLIWPNPSALLGEFSGPFSLAVFGGLAATTQKSSSLISGLHWTARYDTLTIGHEPVKVYRLETRLLDRYPRYHLRQSRGPKSYAQSCRTKLSWSLSSSVAPEAEQKMIELVQLVKKFGDLVAVNNVSLTINAGNSLRC